NLANLTYNDLCGPPTSPSRICNIGGNIITPANHDVGEEMADSRFTSMRETMSYCMSPAIAFVAGPAGTPNSPGITARCANAREGCLAWCDRGVGMINRSSSRRSWVLGQETSPTLQTNGCRTWGDRRCPGFILFNPEPQCFTDLQGFRNDGFAPTPSN